MTQFSPEMEAWIDVARQVSTYDAFTKLRVQPKLHKTSEGWAGPCPSCGDGGRPATSDRFSINAKEGVWLCRKCGKHGGDGIQLIVEMDGEPFLAAVEVLNGTARPDGLDQRRVAVDDEALRERAEERRVEQAQVEAVQRDKKETERDRISHFFEGLSPFKGSTAEQYLRHRKIVLDAGQCADLRFAPALDYRGYASRDSDRQEVLGAYPAMVAAIRDVNDVIIGVHRTYIDPETGLKLKPPGDLFRNKAKKVWGSQSGGLIRLGPVRPVMAIGEGIETTASWYLLGIGPDDVGIAAGVNLGNVSGKATGSLPHPDRPGATVYNGVPLPEAEQTALVPPPVTRTIILLIDGDSDKYTTLAKIVTAGRRFRDHFGVDVLTCHPGIAGDFNDLLMKGAA